MVLPLSNVRILDLTQLLPGPYCTMILADLGAEVIRVQNPSFQYENLPPYYEKDGKKISALNTIIMRNKKSIALDLKQPEAQEIFYELTKTADVIIESFRPGIAKRLKIDYETLKSMNPQLIYCSLSGYGQTGPYSQNPGHDLNFQAFSGNLLLNHPFDPFTENHKEQDKPFPLALQAADIGGSLYSTIGILSCLIQKMQEPQFQGEYIDIAMLDCAFSMNPYEAAFALSKAKKDIDILHGNYAFYNIFETKDHKYLAVANFEQKFWNQFCEAIELPGLKQKAWMRGKIKRNVFKTLEERLKEKEIDEWTEIFRKYEVCVSPALSYGEALQNIQLKSRGMIQEEQHSILGSIQTIKSPINFKSQPNNPPKSDPQMGEHTSELLEELGYSEDKILAFKKKELFGNFYHQKIC